MGLELGGLVARPLALAAALAVALLAVSGAGGWIRSVRAVESERAEG